MKYFHLDAEIDKDLMNRFYEFCNQYENDEWTISLFTAGGATAAGKTIIHIINQRPEKVTLICHEAYSSGFDILYNSNCKKILAETCKGMVHLSATQMWMQSNNKPCYREDECVIRNWEYSTSFLKMVKKFLTVPELKDFKEGEDVYFTFKRMKEIFPDAEII